MSEEMIENALRGDHIYQHRVHGNLDEGVYRVGVQKDNNNEAITLSLFKTNVPVPEKKT